MYYTASGIITPAVGRQVQRLREADSIYVPDIFHYETLAWPKQQAPRTWATDRSICVTSRFHRDVEGVSAILGMSRSAVIGYKCFFLECFTKENWTDRLSRNVSN